MSVALKRSLVGFTLLAMAFGSAAPAVAGGSSYIRTRNETDKYVWMTVYSKRTLGPMKQEGAWCIAPHANDDHGLRAEVAEVRSEVSTGGCQRTPMLLDRTWPVSSREINPQKDVNFYGFVKNVGGVYIFTH